MEKTYPASTLVASTFSAGASLSLSLPGAQQQDFLVVEIADHGIGLSDEAMSGLFSPFKQAQRLAGGTGNKS